MLRVNVDEELLAALDGYVARMREGNRSWAVREILRHGLGLTGPADEWKPAAVLAAPVVRPVAAVRPPEPEKPSASFTKDLLSPAEARAEKMKRMAGNDVF